MAGDFEHVDVLILGAGPCGLGAARRLEQLGIERWSLLEREDQPGGLASSFLDDQGFTWDIGGHVQFSHYADFDLAMDEFLGPAGWNHITRAAWIWFQGRFVPYPLQNNLHRLDPELRDRYLDDMEAARTAGRSSSTFLGWLRSTFGASLSSDFLEPYNEKVWAYPLDELGASWVDDRVAVPDPTVLRAHKPESADDVSWGPNATFRFPKHGGTGAIWTACASRLPADRLRLSEEVLRIDPDRRRCVTSTGRIIEYKSLISTMPLDRLIELVGLVEYADVAARGLRHSSSNIVGLGLEGQTPMHLVDKSWMYFPDDDCPFYRATVLSNYAESNVPRPGSTWSLMLEVAESPHRPVSQDALVDDVVAGCLAVGLIDDPARVISTWRYRAPYGYPTPGLYRDEAIAQIIPSLEERGIFSRGRFGLWRYEVSNQDHTFMQGVEVVDRIILGTPEVTK